MDNHLLFCFPYAGGSGSIFSRWKQDLDGAIEMRPVEYAGRGKRFHEEFYTDMQQAVDDIFECMKDRLAGRRYSFFGHSMGGLIAYELCKKLKREAFDPPLHLFISAVKSPGQAPGTNLHLLPDEQLKREIMDFNGTPAALFQNPELTEIFLPLLRADFRLIGQYKHADDGMKLDSDITAMFGSKDSISSSDAELWRDYTNRQFRKQGFSGGHFFINDCKKDVLRLISETLVPKSYETMQ